MACLGYKFWSLVVAWLYIVAIAILAGVLTFTDFLIDEDTILDDIINKRVFVHISHMAMYLIPVLVVYFITTTLLITGIHKQRRNLMVPFICVGVVCVIATLGLFLPLYYLPSKFALEIVADFIPCFSLNVLLNFPVWMFYRKLGKIVIIIQPTNDVVPLQTVSLN